MKVPRTIFVFTASETLFAHRPCGRFTFLARRRERLAPRVLRCCFAAFTEPGGLFGCFPLKQHPLCRNTLDVSSVPIGIMYGYPKTLVSLSQSNLVPKDVQMDHPFIRGCPLNNMGWAVQCNAKASALGTDSMGRTDVWIRKKADIVFSFAMFVFRTRYCDRRIAFQPLLDARWKAPTTWKHPLY